VRIGSAKAKGSRHTEVHDEFETSIQGGDQEFPTAPYPLDAAAGEPLDAVKLTGKGRMRVPPDVVYPPARKLGIELATDGLDLGQLRHADRLFIVEQSLGAPDARPRKPEVGPDAFDALDLRAGRVVGAEPHPEARKPALRLRVDFGPSVGVLQTSAQVTNYPSERLVGRMVVGAINLGSRRIAGFRSEFLILGSINRDGTVLLLRTEEGARPGAPIA
jgi:tRNA-binding protein